MVSLEIKIEKPYFCQLKIFIRKTIPLKAQKRIIYEKIQDSLY